MNSTPASLLERLSRSQDAEAWSAFVRLYSPLLYDWARRTCPSDADAADLVQDVFATLVQQLPEFHYDPSRSFRAWLHTVMRNRWRALLRKPRPLLSGQLDSLPEPDDPAFPDETEERRHLLAQALRLIEGEFHPTTWQAFRANVVEGQPVALVAGRLNLSINAVYVAKSRVLQRLRQVIKGMMD